MGNLRRGYNLNEQDARRVTAIIRKHTNEMYYPGDPDNAKSNDVDTSGSLYRNGIQDAENGKPPSKYYLFETNEDYDEYLAGYGSVTGETPKWQGIL